MVPLNDFKEWRLGDLAAPRLASLISSRVLDNLAGSKFAINNTNVCITVDARNFQTGHDCSGYMPEQSFAARHLDPELLFVKTSRWSKIDAGDIT